MEVAQRLLDAEARLGQAEALLSEAVAAWPRDARGVVMAWTQGEVGEHAKEVRRLLLALRRSRERLPSA